jgi:hypothetical protein
MEQPSELSYASTSGPHNASRRRAKPAVKQPHFELDLDILRHNARSWLGYLAGRELWAVVKSNAYGLGLERVAKACVESGA